MPRFDIYTLADCDTYVMDVQSEFVDFLPTRLVIPLFKEQQISQKIPTLHIPIRVNDQTLYTITNMMAAVPARLLRNRIGNASHASHDITAAMDFLFQGF